MECDSIFFLFLFVASTVVCGNPASPCGVTVLQPHTTTVSSAIVYQCQQSGFALSPPSSVCVNNGTWSPDPTQVVCMMIPTTSMSSMSPTTATYRWNARFNWKDGIYSVFQLVMGVKSLRHALLNNISQLSYIKQNTWHYSSFMLVWFTTAQQLDGKITFLPWSKGSREDSTSMSH